MIGQQLRRTLREMLPAGVCVAAGPTLELPLMAHERASLGIADADRLSEFQNGRAYAKRALKMLAVDHVDLPIAPDRGPIWPEMQLSITHIRWGHDSIYAAAAAMWPRSASMLKPTARCIQVSGRMS